MALIIIEIILLLIIFLTIIFILPIKLGVKLDKDMNNEDFYVTVCIMPGIFSLQLEMTLFKIHFKELIPHIIFNVETEGTSGQPIHKGKIYIDKPWLNLKKLIEISPFYRTKILLALVRRLLLINSAFFKQIVCQKLEWKTTFGFGDPALTAISTGSIWAAKSLLYVNLKRNVQVNFQKPLYEVHPCFTGKEFHVSFDCIFTFRFGHIITAGYKTLIVTIRSLIAQRG